MRPWSSLARDRFNPNALESAVPTSRKPHRASRPLCMGAALLCMSPAIAQAKAARPDPLPAEAGCDHYRGQPVGANDPTQQFELMICTTSEGVQAKVQTSSLVSGWSVRQSVGSWDASGRVLSLRETEFIESKPEPGWRFCLIDSIVLEKTDAGLSGSYVSEACNDRAQLELQKLEQDDGPAATDTNPEGERPAAPPPPDAPREPEPAPEEEPAKPGCACELASAEPSALAWLLLGFFFALAINHRRPARRP